MESRVNHLKTRIAIGPSDDTSTPVMSIQTRFGNHYSDLSLIGHDVQSKS
jgi:hypothetical protein